MDSHITAQSPPKRNYGLERVGEVGEFVVSPSNGLLDVVKVLDGHRDSKMHGIDFIDNFIEGAGRYSSCSSVNFK